MRHTVSLQVSGNAGPLLEITLPLADLASQSVTLGYRPAAAKDVTFLDAAFENDYPTHFPAGAFDV
ncbi:MAG: hypothetical protein GWO24_18965, partial [Akkermansiaceae bacterium]|nr:hypothetical protein [Akkermansiaceae bacterium]